MELWSEIIHACHKWNFEDSQEGETKSNILAMAQRGCFRHEQSLWVEWLENLIWEA